jgi:hypothetical protein
MRQTPNQVPTNSPAGTGSNKFEAQFFALFNAIAETAVIGTGERNGGAPSVLTGALGVATLQSQHVRIQT